MNHRDRRALLAGGILVALAVLALRVAPWGWRRVTEARAELQARAELLARMREEVASAATLEDSATLVRGRMAALAPRLLAGGTGTEAMADLSSRVAAAADRHRVQLGRTEPASDSTERAGLHRATLRTTLESDTPGLLRLLEALANESAVLVVDDLRTAVADPHVGRERPEVLHTELTVHGWYLPTERAP